MTRYDASGEEIEAAVANLLEELQPENLIVTLEDDGVPAVPPRTSIRLRRALGSRAGASLRTQNNGLRERDARTEYLQVLRAAMDRRSALEAKRNEEA